MGLPLCSLASGDGFVDVSELCSTLLVCVHACTPRGLQLTNLCPGQTFEGGISGQPDAEAHGAYAFCALGCLSILDMPNRSFPQ